MPAPAKSAELRSIESGNRVRGRYQNAAGSEPDSGKMAGPPAWFTADQRGVWAQLTGQIAPGVLRASDWVRFGELVLAVQTERELVREWNALGCPVMNPPKRNGIRPTTHHIYAALRIARRDIRDLANEFGLNPRARKDVKVPKAATVNPLDKFLGGKAG